MNTNLCIYSLSETQEKIDDYVIYFLENIKKYYKRILVVSTENLPDTESKKLKKINVEYYYPDEECSSFYAYKKGLEFIGYEELKSSEELLLCDSSLFGPLFDLKDFFAAKNNSKADIWGGIKSKRRDVILHPKARKKYVNEYIHPSFIVFGRNVLNSPCFSSFFKKLKPCKTELEEFVLSITELTEYFSKKGFQYDTFINDDKFLDNHHDCSVYCSLETAADYHYPFVVKKAFVENYNSFLTSVAGYQPADLFNYIKTQTTYPAHLILDNLLRTEYQAVIRNNLHFNYILSSTHSPLAASELKNEKTALFMHLYYEDLMAYCLQYAQNMPDNTDVFLTVISESMKEKAEKVFAGLNYHSLTVKVIKNQGRDVSALLIGGGAKLAKYDYVCFMHDKKTLQLKPQTVGQDFSYHCFEGNLASKAYVLNVIKTFRDNPQLGLVTPPPPEFGSFYTISGFEWATDYNIAKSLARKLNFHVKLEAEPIAPFGTMFWFRGKALKPLLDYKWKYEDFPKEPTGVNDGTIMHALERLYPLTVQNAGYYPAWVLPDYFASRYLDNNCYMLRQLKIKLFNKYGFLDFNNMLYMMGLSDDTPRITTKYVKKVLKTYLKQKLRKIFAGISRI